MLSQALKLHMVLLLYIYIKPCYKKAFILSAFRTVKPLWKCITHKILSQKQQNIQS